MIFQLPFTVLGSESVSVSHKKEAHGLILKKKMLNRRVCVCVQGERERKYGCCNLPSASTGVGEQKSNPLKLQ